MKQLFLFLALMCVVAVEAMAQADVPPVLTQDDSLPVLNSVMLDPTDRPLSFHSSSFFDVFTEVSLDFTGSLRAALQPFGGVAMVHGSAMLSAAVSSSSAGTVDFNHWPVIVSMSVQLVGDSGGVRTYSTELLQMDVSGGGLPGGVMVRESPTKASLGRTTVRPVSGGYMVSSFFDVFTELSVDGGSTWTPSNDSLRLQATVNPTQPDVPSGSVSPPGIFVADLDRDGSPDLIITDRSPSPPSPPVDSSVTNAFTCSVIYVFGGLQRSASCTAAIRIGEVCDDGNDRYYDGEVLQLDISGGTLPPGVMVRESPTKQSLGRTSVRMVSGAYRISSFFDIFTDLSVDGGATWTPQQVATLSYSDTLPASSGPPETCQPVATYPDDLWPSSGDVDFQSSSSPSRYSNGMTYQWSLISVPAGSSSSRMPLPLLGATQVYDTDVDCGQLVSFGGGSPPMPVHFTGHETVKITHSSDNGTERDYDQEMIALDLTGNGGAVGTVMVRESPTKASIGRRTVAPNGSGFRISSFFDVFTEVSLDGGATWTPSDDSMHIEQMLMAPPAPSGALHSSNGGMWSKSDESCGNGLYADGAQLAQLSFFDVFLPPTIPSVGSTTVSSTPAACRATMSLDGGNSFFDVFFDVSLSLQLTGADSLPGGNVCYGELSMGNLTLRLRESPTLQHLRLRESPTLPSKGMVVSMSNSPTCRSFFDIFTEISLDDGATWSPSTSAMRVVLDTAVGGSISGMKWHDVNGNGVVDPGENGLSNWKVTLLDTTGAIVDTVRTDNSGNYSFQNIPAGTYRVLEEPVTGWIQTGGQVAYGFATAPGDSITDVDFGNFQAPTLSGIVYDDRNGNGARDGGEEGIDGGLVGLAPAGNQNPGTSLHSMTGSFSLRLNGLPPGEPVLGRISGYSRASQTGWDLAKQKGAAISPRAGKMKENTVRGYSRIVKGGAKGRTVTDYSSSRKGWDGTIKGNKFEDGDIPTEMQVLSLSSTSPVDVGGHPYDVSFEQKKDFKGHVTLLKLYDDEGRMRPPQTPGAPVSSFFDVFTEVQLTPRQRVASAGYAGRLTVELLLAGDLDGDGELDCLQSGKTYKGGPADVLDSNGVVVGVLDSLVLLVGQPASPSEPALVRADSAGQYQFSLMSGGDWRVGPAGGSCWNGTTSPQPVSVTSGATIPPVSLGSHSSGGTLCVTKYYDKNHNHLLDPGEPPMSGVTFIVTGLNASDVFSGQTDANGNLCISGLPPDSYTLQETVPSGYVVSSPQSGSFSFVVTSCESTGVQWLDAAALTDTNFRTATMADWANALKSVKCKSDKVDFRFLVRVPPPNVTKGVTSNFTGVTFTFNVPVDSLQGYAQVSSETIVFRPNRGDVKRLVWACPVPNPDSVQAGDSLWFWGRGLKGSLAKVSYKWTTSAKPTLRGSLPAKPAVTGDAFVRNQLLLPMPSLSNVGDDLNLKKGFPFTIGASSGPKSVLIDLWKTAQKSLSDGKGTVHTGPAVCLSDPKIFKKQVKGLPPKAFSDKLFAEVLALALNLKASSGGDFPGGLGSLIYDAPADSADTSSSFFNGITLDSVLSRSNLWLTCAGGTPMTGDDVYFVVHRINGAFADSGRVDTTSWSCGNLELKGVRPLSSVSFLRANPGTAQSGAGKGSGPVVVHPTEFALYQNYPNPFNPTTTLRFDIPRQSVVTLKIYNILGQEVATLLDHQVMDDGQHEERFDGSRLASGVYIYRMIAQPVSEDGGTAGAVYTSIKKMVLLK